MSALLTAPIDLLDVERAAAMIRQCKDADTVREIRDQARAIETYQRQRRADGDHFAEVFADFGLIVWPERRAA